MRGTRGGREGGRSEGVRGVREGGVRGVREGGRSEGVTALIARLPFLPWLQKKAVRGSLEIGKFHKRGQNTT